MFEPGDYIVYIKENGESLVFDYWVRIWPGELVTEHNVINKIWKSSIREKVLNGTAKVLKVAKNTRKSAVAKWEDPSWWF